MEYVQEAAQDQSRLTAQPKLLIQALVPIGEDARGRAPHLEVDASPLDPVGPFIDVAVVQSATLRQGAEAGARRDGDGLMVFHASPSLGLGQTCLETEGKAAVEICWNRSTGQRLNRYPRSGNLARLAVIRRSDCTKASQGLFSRASLLLPADSTVLWRSWSVGELPLQHCAVGVVIGYNALPMHCLSSASRLSQIIGPF